MPSSGAESESGGCSDSSVEITLYRWSERSHWHTRKRALPPPSATGPQPPAHPSASPTVGESGERVPPSSLASAAPLLLCESSSEWGSDEEQALGFFFQHTETGPVQGEAEGETIMTTRRKQILLCVVCGNRYKRKDMYLRHLKTHEVTAEAMMQARESNQQGEEVDTADKGAASSAQRNNNLSPPPFILQPHAALRCHYCTHAIVLFDTMGELLRHQGSEHPLQLQTGTAPPPYLSTPQHPGSVRAPVHRSLEASSSSEPTEEEDEGDGEEGNALNGIRPRMKRTKSILGRTDARRSRKRSANGGEAERSNGHAHSNSMREEDGSAIRCGAMCRDCGMAFSSKNAKYYAHIQLHLRQKSVRSVSEEHLTLSELSESQRLDVLANRMERQRLQLASKPLTRAQLAAMTAPVSASIQLKSPKMRGHTDGASACNCDRCDLTFTRETSYERHLAVCKGKKEGATMSDEADLNADADVEMSEDEETGSKRSSHSSITPPPRSSNRTPAAAASSAGDTPHRKGKFGQCPFCGRGLDSRTRFYVHKRECAKNPAGKAAAARANGEGEAGGSPQSGAGSLTRRSSAQRSSSPSAGRSSSSPNTAEQQPLQEMEDAVRSPRAQPKLLSTREHSFPEAAAAASAPSAPSAASPSVKALKRLAGVSRPSTAFSASSLTCGVCGETFTHPFSCNRHASVHPPADYPGPTFTCPGCSARFMHSQRFHKHMDGCKKLHGVRQEEEEEEEEGEEPSSHVVGEAEEEGDSVSPPSKKLKIGPSSAAGKRVSAAPSRQEITSSDNDAEVEAEEGKEDMQDQEWAEMVYSSAKKPPPEGQKEAQATEESSAAASLVAAAASALLSSAAAPAPLPSAPSPSSSSPSSSSSSSRSMRARTCALCGKEWPRISEYNFEAHRLKCSHSKASPPRAKGEQKRPAVPVVKRGTTVPTVRARTVGDSSSPAALPALIRHDSTSPGCSSTASSATSSPFFLSAVSPLPVRALQLPPTSSAAFNFSKKRMREEEEEEQQQNGSFHSESMADGLDPSAASAQSAQSTLLRLALLATDSASASASLSSNGCAAPAAASASDPAYTAPSMPSTQGHDSLPTHLAGTRPPNTHLQEDSRAALQEEEQDSQMQQQQLQQRTNQQQLAAPHLQLAPPQPPFHANGLYQSSNGHSLPYSSGHTVQPDLSAFSSSLWTILTPLGAAAFPPAGESNNGFLPQMQQTCAATSAPYPPTNDQTAAPHTMFQ